MTIVQYLKVNSFLGILKLESGGIVIGSLGILCALTQLIAETILIFCLIFVDDFCPQQQIIEYFDSETQENIQNVTNYIQESFKNETDIELKCSHLNKIPLIILFFFAICYNAVAIIAHYRVIRGVEELNFQKFLLAIGYYIFIISVKFLLIIVLIVLSIYFSPKFIILAIILSLWAVTDIYFFIVLDTIRFKLEKSPYVAVSRTPTQTIETRLIEVQDDNGEAARIIIPTFVD